MNKIYKATTLKKHFLLTDLLAKAAVIAGIILLTCSSNAFAQVSVGATPYANLTAAFNAINAGTHTGVINITITAGYTEPSMAVLNSSGTGAANYTSVNIKPTGVFTITANLTTPVIKLNGADNVTIDGAISGSSRDLTITNTSTNTASGVIWLGSASASDGATNNVIKNLVVSGNSGSTTLVCIGSSSGTTFGGVAETSNSNNSYLNNLVTGSRYGLAVVGPATGETGTIISNNTIGESSNKIGFKALFVSNQTNFIVSNNTISSVTGTDASSTNNTSGITLVGAISGGDINANTIFDIKNTNTLGWNTNGITLSSSSSNTGTKIYNNFIYDIAGFGWAGNITDNGHGIEVNTGGGYQIYYNSISLSTNQNLATSNTEGIYIGTSATINSLNIRNNIFSVTQTTGTRYAIYCAQSNSVFSTINFNDYYATGGTLGFLGSSRTTIAAWQSATGQDANSVNLDPQFTSNVNLHLLGSSPLDALATPIAAVTTVDIDGQTRNASNPDIGADEFTSPNCSSNSGGTASVNYSNICPNTPIILTCTGYAFGNGISYQWEYDNGGGWTPLAGQTIPASASVASLAVTTNFRLRVTCSLCCGGAPGYSVPVTVNVTNPSVTGTTPASRCGTGTLVLGATAASGTLNWYAAASGGTALYASSSPSSFTTPSISSTTTYYVSNTVGGGSGFVGPVYSGTNTNGSNVGSHGISITTSLPNITINSVDIPFAGTGTITVALKDINNTTVITSVTSGTVNGLGTTALTIPLGLTITTAGSYLLVVQSVTGSISSLGYTTTNSYPYSALAGAFTINSGYWYGTDPDNMYLFNLNVSSGCEGTRTAVTATITTPPAFTSVTPVTPTSICGGQSVNLNASGGGYTSFTWNPGGLVGAAQTVSPSSTTVYTLTATTPSNCRRDTSINIIVNPTPTNLTVTPATASVCATGAVTTITATGGTLVGQTIHAETFETFPLAQYVISGSGVTAAQNTTYYSQGTSSVKLTPGNNANGGLGMSSSINLSTYTNPVLTFSHICATEVSAGGTHYDFGYIEYSVDGGTNWTVIPAGNYAGSGTLQGTGGIGFDKTSYSDWNAQFTSDLSDPGAGPATSLWKQETINLSSFGSQTNFRIRFKMTSDGSIIYYGWLIDDVKISGDGQAPITWAPQTNLWQNLGCTIPVLAGTNISTVYSNTGSSITYTATATGGVGCTKTATSTLNVSALAASVSITANPSGTICQNGCVTFTANTVNGGGAPGYKWLVNGSQVNLPLGFNPGQSVYTICGLQNNDQVQCVMFSNAGGCVSNPNNSNIITVFANPRPSVSINQASGPLCFPQTLTLTTTGTISTYEWFLNGGAVGTNSPTYNAAGAGTYTCIVTSNLGCKDTSVARVYTQQTYTITSSATNGSISPSGPTVVNCGANQVFTYTANPGYSVCNVYIDGVDMGALASPYTFTNVTGNHTIDVTFCIPGCPYLYTANAGPTVFICANQTFTLGGSISCTPSNGSFGATWSTGGDGTFNGGGVFGVATTYTPGAGDISGGVVFLTLTTNNPGGGSCTAATSTMQLRIRPIPTVSISGTLGVCSAGATSTLLTANASLASGTITGYQWYNVTTSTNLGTASTQTVTAAGTYSVTVTGSNTCSNTAQVVVVNFPTPSVSISPGSATVCTGDNVTLTATPSGGSGSYGANAYVWYNPAVIGGATSATLSATASGSPYTVTVSDSQGCQSNPSGGVTVSTASGPLNGAYTIGAGPASCTNYVSFASAINDLNTRTISGNVRFDVPAGYTETITSTLSLGSAALNATLSGRTLLFQKSGSGANPVINAYVGTKTPADAAPDGIWNLKGVDNVTITSIDLVDGNTTNPASMEYGYGLFKLSATDGAQNNTIQNCTITLNRVNDVTGSAAVPLPDGSTGILVMNSLATTANVAITPTAASGTNSGNKFYANTIQNCNNGIALMGYAATVGVGPAPNSATFLGDLNNDIGGIDPTTGNNIINFGGAVASGQTAMGVRAFNQWSSNISYNTINNNNGSGVSHTNTIRGIYAEAGLSGNVTISNNTVTLTRAGTASGLIAIENIIGSTAAGNTVNITNNTVSTLFGSATTGNSTNIVNSATAATVNINNNLVQNCTLTGSGNWIGISNTANVTTLSMSNNTLQNSALLTTATGATFVAIGNTGTATTLNMNSNAITGNTKPINSGALTWMSTGTPSNITVSSNNISNNTVNGSGATAAITVNCILASGVAGTVLTANTNTINNNSISLGAAGFAATLLGYSNVTAMTTENITNNTISNLYITGTNTAIATAHTIRGISDASGTTNKTYTGNQVSKLYSSAAISAAITGIFNQLGTNGTYSKNRIHSLFPGQSAAAAAAFAKGIAIQGGSTAVNASNNYVSIDLTQAATATSSVAANNVLTGNDAVKGIEITSGGTVNIYYNTIRLAGGGSGTGFGSSGIGITSGTPVTDIRNNLVSNFMTPGGTSPGLTVGLRRSTAVLTNYAATSNNNLWYTTELATTPLYFDGTAYATLAAFKTQVSTRETASIDDLPVFVDITTNDLHLAVGSNCGIDGGAQVIAGYTDDYDAVGVRDASFPDIGADEFTATGGSPNWRGRNTNWMNTVNWCGVIPTAATDVVIPNGVANYPVITTSAPVAKSITIASAASVTINAGGRLTVNSNFANSGTLTNNGRIVLNGTSSQSFPGTGTVAAMDTLEVNNNGAGANINKAFTITGALLPTLGTITLNANNITLKSTAAKTAQVGIVGTTDAFVYNSTGRFVVERYIATGNPPSSTIHGKTWQYMAVPTKGDNLKASWMEGEGPGHVGGATGFGTMVTSEKGSATTRGYDAITTPGPSLKTYVPATNSWTGIDDGTTNTSAVSMTSQKGFMVFVRGDRSIQTLTTANPTVLRTTGKLYAPGTEAPAAVSVPTGLFEGIANPYASAINFTALGHPNVQNLFYVWDPKLTSGLGFGAYQTIDIGLATVVPGSGSYPSYSPLIQSGQAFFVKSTGAGSQVSFTEAAKANGSSDVFRPFSIPVSKLRANIFVTSGSTPILVDGNLVSFSTDYSNDIDEDDAIKLMNSTENFGMMRLGKNLIIEKRKPVVSADTIFYSLGNMAKRNYELRFEPEIMPAGLEAYLVDKYLNNKTTVSLVANTAVSFEVNDDPASAASDRFMLVFRKTATVPPVKFVSIDAFKQAENIMVNWKMEYENGMDHYEVEKSANGISDFSKIGEKAASGNGSAASSYNWLDVTAWVGDNFYRIKSVGMNGEIMYSAIVKVNVAKTPPFVTVYPNPVPEDRNIYVNFNNKPAGEYVISLTNHKGQRVMTRTINHTGGNNVYTVTMSKASAHGNYVLSVSGDDKVKLTFKIVY